MNVSIDKCEYGSSAPTLVRVVGAAVAGALVGEAVTGFLVGEAVTGALVGTFEKSVASKMLRSSNIINTRQSLP